MTQEVDVTLAVPESTFVDAYLHALDRPNKPDRLRDVVAAEFVSAHVVAQGEPQPVEVMGVSVTNPEDGVIQISARYRQQDTLST